MNTKNILIGVLVVAIVIGVAAYIGKPEVTEKVVERVIQEKIGAMPGNELQWPQFTVNGLATQFNSIAMLQATRTPCAIRAPVDATSTLMFASVEYKVSSTTASIVDLAKASTAYATTTKIGTTFWIGANKQATILASTSPATGDTTTFAPGEWFVVKMGGGDGTFSPTGYCKAEFKVTSKN